ncbi:MAG TPA: hypothetical protein VGK72_00005 [Chthoniobacterales bacterium]
MFPLRTNSLPPDAEALRVALEESLCQIVKPAHPEMVAVEDRNYPELAAIRVSLDNATARDLPPPRLAPPVGEVAPALHVEHFEVTGQPVRVQRAAVDLSCVAEDVYLGQGRDRDGNLLLLLQKAAHGKIEISLPLSDLEGLVRSAASAVAARQGIILEDMQLRVRPQTARALAIETQVRARKLFLTTEVRIEGKVEIDEQLDAHLTGLQCRGEGTLGTLACGFLGPHLTRLNNRKYPLLALPFGEAKLRDIQIAVDQNLTVTAQFGSEA